MKGELRILLFANLCLIYFILYYTFDLHMLIIDPTTEDAIATKDIAPNSTLLNDLSPDNKMIIPKIIHQTYKNENIPPHWKVGQEKCQELNPDYKYILWTDVMIEDFITKNFNWFLPIMKSYKYPIQKADIIRYFVLWTYGGVYIDLDDTCERNLDPLLKYPVFLRKTSPFGVSNDVMGSIPKHPFFLKAINSLKHYNKNWGAPYFTIMASTGPVFISIIWKQYKRWEKLKQVWDPTYQYITSDRAVKVLQPWDYKDTPNAFFSISKGSSWHLDDADFIKSFLTHILSCVVAGFILGFVILYGEYCIYCFMCAKKNYNLLSIWNKIRNDILGYNRTYNNTTTINNTSTNYNNNSSFTLPKFSNRMAPNRLRKDSNNLMNLIDLEKNNGGF
ncbi:mannosyl phosphorylinositol ceramide synthase Csh1p [Monosporozyma unispora]|nr:hypothetical protein C6P44_002941 [Kazachstania unispora]